MPQKIHPSLTRERVEEAIERYQKSTDNPGFCLACGAEAEGVEPDAEGYDCEACGADQVSGVELIYLTHFA